MADVITIQDLVDGHLDIKGMATFYNGAAGIKVPRRLADDIETLEFYLEYMRGLQAVYEQPSGMVEVNGVQVKPVKVALDDALNAAVVGGGGLADTAVATVPQLTGAVARTQSQVNSERVSIKTFGIVGDGVADDTIGVEKAIKSGQSIDWLDVVCKITRSISATYTKGAFIKWYGKGAKIVYSGAHAEYAIRMSGVATAYSLEADITIDGGKLVNKGLEVLSDTASMADSELSSFVADNLKIVNIKRNKIFLGGDGLYIKGGFSRVELRSGCKVKDVELPLGQGTSGVTGVTGVNVSHFGLTGYCKLLLVNGTTTENIYSSDLSYAEDQDGLRFVTPRNADGSMVVAFCIVNNSAKFKNCNGRSIKTQCMITSLNQVFFERDKGGSNNYGNEEVSAQLGYLSTNDITFTYSNGFVPTSCFNIGSDAGIKVSGCDINKSKVFLGSATKLRYFVDGYPRDGEILPSHVSDFKIFGEVEIPFALSFNGSKNQVTIKDGYVEKISSTNNKGIDKTLVSVSASGAIVPYSAYIKVEGVVTSDTDNPALMTDRIAGVSMFGSLSSKGNLGFLDSFDAAYGTDAKNGLQIIREGMIGKKYTPNGSSRSGAFGISESVSISSGATVSVPMRSSGGAFVTVLAAFNKTAFAQMYVFGKTIAVANKGAVFEVGDAIEPTLGIFRVWAENSNEIKIKNTDASTRVFTVFTVSNY